MSSPNDQLPPGWEVEWDNTHQRYLFIESASGHTQWEPPVQQSTALIDQAPVAAHSKRRQYATNQGQMYYGDNQPAPEPAYLRGDQANAPQPSDHLFTPGLASVDTHFVQQQQLAPAEAAYYSGQQDYSNGPSYNQQQLVQPVANHMGAITDQFSQMGVGSQRGYQVQTVNLLTEPSDPRQLQQPPPEIRLPPNTCLSPSPFSNADHTYQRLTLNSIPTTSALLSKAKIPLAVIATPYRSVQEGEPLVPVVSDTVITRCKRCLMYINPFVQFIEGGNRWRCCMCNMSNDVPQMFDWDSVSNQPGDRWSRAELNHAVVEFVASDEYMARAPQPAVYVFLIDVSHPAVECGMLATAVRTILESLDSIPDEDGRTKIAIICFDVSLYFFSMPPEATEATMLVVSDLDDVFLPQPRDLLVNLQEARTALENLLGRLHTLFQDNLIAGNALGPALLASSKLMAPIGGKIMVLTSSLPNVGVGALQNREDSKLLGTPKESTLLQPGNSFYKTFAIDCSRAHVSVDMFILSSSYNDVATLAGLPRYTSGQTYYYPAFTANRPEDAVRFARELNKVISMPIMLEAITRVRASKGIRMSAFHGNFFVRSTDLLAMPAVSQDQSYAIEMEIEETLATPFVVIQTAVLHTTCFGERRVRVVTTAVPTTTSLAEVFASTDQVAIATLFANKAVERSLTHKLEDSREYLVQRLVDILQCYKTSMTAAGTAASSQLSLCENLKMLPSLVLGILKTLGIKQSGQIPPDLRAYSQALLTTLPPERLVPYIYPTFYSLHNMSPEYGTVAEHGVILPSPLPTTSEKLERHGLFLIEDGMTMFLWVGRDAVPALMMDMFDLPNYDSLRGGKATLPALENDFSRRVNAIIEKTREMRHGVYYPSLYIAKEDGEHAIRLWALSLLIQDRADILPSYQQFLTTLKDKVNGNSVY